MTLLEQLQAAAENARKGLPAALTIDADGVQYTRNFMPQERLILLGGGTIAQPLCRYAADLGFELVVADDRPSFANHPRDNLRFCRRSCVAAASHQYAYRGPPPCTCRRRSARQQRPP